jgi:hypothetical protein
MLITKVPGLDTPRRLSARTCPRSETSSRAWPRAHRWWSSNARTGERHLIWAEIDSNPSAPADRVLIIRPGRNFDGGKRYMVALRYLKDESGKTLEAQRNFRRYRDMELTQRPPVESGRRHFEALFRRLKKARICGGASTWPGTSRSQAARALPGGRFTSATRPSRRSATRTSRTSRCRAARPGSRSTW